MEEHEAEVDISFGVITISSSRYERYGRLKGVENIPDDDESGRILVEELNAKRYILVPDDKTEIISATFDMLRDVDVVVTTGGTGLSPMDVTIEALKPLVEKEIEGFGEIFRFLSYREIGERAILTRAFAGVLNNKVIFCLPGSKNAVKTGLRIIKSQIRHIISHVRGIK